jgi:hypothetical protein
LVPADEVKIAAFDTSRRLPDHMLNLPDRLAVMAASNTTEVTLERKPATAACPSMVPQIERWLPDKGIIRRSEESLTETTARALGISPQELRRRLFLPAHGGGSR